jgi:lysozyme
MAAANFTPGNRDPNRYKRRSALSAAVLALVLAGASAPDILEQYIGEREGSREVSYLDGGSTTVKRIWTICKGLTKIDGQPVTKDMKLSKEECARHDRKELVATIAELERLVLPHIWVGLSEPAKAGIASFCTYNLGATKCRGTTFLKLLNEGRRNEACAQITRWIRDGGKDCRYDRSCRGQVDRRMGEDELCLVESPA